MGNEPKSPDAFNLERIQAIIELMNENDLGEVSLRQGDSRIKLRKRGSELAAAPVAAAAPTAPAAAPPADEPSKYKDIKSPMLGTFYRASSPEAEPYVKVGTVVESDSTVCMIEAMKVFNEIPAEASGKIVEILVENGQPVEFGQVLFRVEPSA